VTADHGEEFLEHGNRYHSPVGLPEHLIRVPLLIYGPSASNGRTITGLFSMIHLAPTLLEAVGVESPSSFQGSTCWSQILSGELPENPAIVECVAGCNNPLSITDRLQPRLLAVRNRDYKLVIRFEDHSEDLYCLKDDPLEQHPLPVNVGTNERRHLWNLAGKHVRESRERRDPRLALRSKFREIRRQLSLTGHAGAKQIQGPFEIAGHG
jgi:arylsulfatase A-like enzyme